MGILADSDLTPKQQIFVDSYISNGFNATQAARQAGYKGNEVTLQAVGSENLRKPLIQQQLKQRTKHITAKAEKRIIKARDEFEENLDFARKLRKACVKWLVDPDDPEAFTIDPRANEIDVIYMDGVVQRRSTLAELLAKVDGIAHHASPFIKTVDLREYAIKALDKCDMAIDKFAKMDGEYMKDKENPVDPIAHAKTVLADIITKGMLPRDEAIVQVAEHYGLDVAQLGDVG